MEKYNNLNKEYNQLKAGGTDLNNLKRELKEKEEKIKQLNNGNVWYKTSYNDYNLANFYNDLMVENYDLKNKLNLYETHYKAQSGPIFLDNDFNNIRNSISQNNKIGFTNAITQLRTNLDNVTQNNYNTIIMMKDKEIEKWKEQERIRREREKQQFSELINKYDQTLTLEEYENRKLKMRLKELQNYFN